MSTTRKTLITIYILCAAALCAATMLVHPATAAGPWYVAPGGNDGNGCLSPATPCATLGAALNKPGFVSGDTVRIAVGTYFGTGSEVAPLSNNVTLAGGWDSAFTQQTGVSTIDGQGVRRGITVGSGVTATVDYIVVQDGYNSFSGGGIMNGGAALTLNHSTVNRNRTGNYGGGIYNDNARLTLNHSTVSGNTAGSHGGGILNNGGAIILNGTSIIDNKSGGAGGGIIINTFGGSLVADNSTVSGNTSTLGGGIYTYGNLQLNNTTIVHNTDPNYAGGIYSHANLATLRNTILADNTGPNCGGDGLSSAGYNLIGDMTGCSITTTVGDLTNTSPNLGPLIGSPPYHPLIAGSPAIDAGNPAGCIGSAGLLSTDQRGAPRVGTCDIGSYEYTVPGPPARIDALAGTPQHTPPLTPFPVPLQAYVVDNIGSPVSNASVLFAAPSGGASGTFMGSGTFTATALTGAGGVVTAPVYTANGSLGLYTVTASVSGVVTPANFLLGNIAWLVSNAGSDGNDCLSPATTCATIAGTMNRGNFFPGDMLRVAIGAYTGTLTDVVTINKPVILSGGWDAGFTAQPGMSTIDGEGARRGISNNSTAVIERFIVQNGYPIIDPIISGAHGDGGGIYNTGRLALNSSAIRGNRVHNNGFGAGIYDTGVLTLTNSAVTDNDASIGYGGGIEVSNQGVVALNDSTVSRNVARTGGGIDANTYGGAVTLNSSTLTANRASRSAGGINSAIGYTVTIRNSIVAGNFSAGASPECAGNLASLGYNLLGSPSGCGFVPGTGDLTNANPVLGQLVGMPGYVPLLIGSPAIDTGNPAGCLGSDGVLSTDERGAARVGRCDIGAYEYTVAGPPARVVQASGAPQQAAPLTTFENPLVATVFDGIGTPVRNVTVTFTAPGAGPGATFAGGGTTTSAVTDASGNASSPVSANAALGSYAVSATVSGVPTPTLFALSNVAQWYVSLAGSDPSDCQSPGTPCRTVGGVLAKAGFAPGDTVLVASGTYIGSGTEVIALNKSVSLVGGYQNSFLSLAGNTVIDGQAARRGISVASNSVVSLRRFTVQHGYSNYAGGISVDAGASAALRDSNFSANTSNQEGAAIWSSNGAVTIDHTTVSANSGANAVAGVGMYLTINASTISGNAGTGVSLDVSGALFLNNSTVSGNSGSGIAYSGNSGALSSSTISRNGVTGVANGGFSPLSIRNTLVANNVGSDCIGTFNGFSYGPAFTSLGYNLIGNTSGCSYTSATGDLTGTNPLLFPLIGAPGYHPLLRGSPAIDAGNPGGCVDGAGNLLATDERGVARVGRCDIGAYEYDPNNGPLRYTYLPTVMRN